MGRAARWFRGLFGLSNKKDKEFNISGKCHGGLCYNPLTIPPNMSEAEAAWCSSTTDRENQQHFEHSIAVAVATAAAADAAVAAAQAAAAVVRLIADGGSREKWASVIIQTQFRAYLAKKALRALKGLVKIQALVRGYLVRKQAAKTLHCMEALIRAQNSVRIQKGARARITSNNNSRFHSECKSGHIAASIHSSRRLSATFESSSTLHSIDENPNIAGNDTGRRKSRRNNNNNNNSFSVSDFRDDPFYQTVSSPLLYQLPPRLSTPDCHQYCHHQQQRGYANTAQNTPPFINARHHYNPHVTPSKNECLDSFFSHCSNNTNSPNYMMSTESFKEKLRSHSAPKQRPGLGPGGENHNHRESLSFIAMMGTRSRLSGTKMQRSTSQVEESVNFKNAVMGKFDKSSKRII